MTQARRFDEQTHWDHDPGGVRAGGAGWAPPGADFFIDRADPYWGRVLGKARYAYGDPNMHFNTDSVGQERQLVFGDGTPVPRDGSLAYRDAANNKTYLLNDDGTVSPLDPNGAVGQPVSPVAFRRTADGQYAPIDSGGHQVAPLTTAPPAAGPALRTDEQQSGRAADAVKKLHEEMQNRYSDISDAEGKLSEVLLTAHATTADGQQKLQAIQQKMVEAIDNPDLSLDTPAGEQAFLTFLRGQVAAIGDVVASGTLSAEDQAKAVEALSNLYGSDPGSPPVPVDAPPVEDGLGTEEPMPDPTLSDLGLGGVGAPPPADRLSTLASALPAALGAFPSGGLDGGFGGDPFSSLAGAAAPLAGLASQLGEQPRRDDTTDDPNIDRYGEAIGHLLWISVMTRPDISFTTGFLARRHAFVWTPRNLDNTYDMAILSIHPGNAAARGVHLGLLPMPAMFGGEPHALVGGDTAGLKGGDTIDSLVARHGDDKRSIGYDAPPGVPLVLIVQGNFDTITVTVTTY